MVRSIRQAFLKLGLLLLQNISRQSPGGWRRSTRGNSMKFK